MQRSAGSVGSEHDAAAVVTRERQCRMRARSALLRYRAAIVDSDQRVRDVISTNLRCGRSRRWRWPLSGLVGAPGHDEADAVALVLENAERHPTTLLALGSNKLLYLSRAQRPAVDLY